MCRAIPIALLSLTALVSPLSGEGGSVETDYDHIVGGSDVVPGEFPFVVEISSRVGEGTFSCTGSLVAPDRVLTAKHCVEDSDSAWIYFDRRVSRFQRSAHFDLHDDLDIAIIFLSERVSEISPVPLHDEVSQGDIGASVGWGRTRSVGSCDEEAPRSASPVFLQKAPVRIGHVGRVLLAGTDGEQGGYIECGDSGGPLLLWTMQGWAQVGVAGATNHSGTGSYSNTTVLRSWILGIDPEPEPVDSFEGKLVYTYGASEVRIEYFGSVIESDESYYHIQIHNRGLFDLDCRIIRAAVGFERDVRITAFEGKVSPGIVQEVRREIRIYAGTKDLKWEVYLDRRLIPEKTDSHPPEPNADPFEYHRTFKRMSQEASWLSVDCQVFPGEWPNPSQCRITGSFEETYRLSEYLVGCHSRDESNHSIENSGRRWVDTLRWFGGRPSGTVVLNYVGDARIPAPPNAVDLKCAVRVGDVWWREVVE